MVDFRTPSQKRKDANDERVVSLFLNYRSNPQYKDVADYRIFDAIAKDPQVTTGTVAGVRAILVRKAVYTSARR